MANNVVHFAIHADDVERARRFYASVAVDDLGETRDLVVANGGSVRYDEMVIPTIGRHIQFVDTEGNEFAAMVYDMDMFGA